MAVVVYGQGATMFSEEELRGLANIERGPNYIEIICVLKSSGHGEFPGKLKIFHDGNLLIKCECVPRCHQDNLSPQEFLMNYRKKQITNWKNQICVITQKDKRVPLIKTPLLKYYYKERPEELKGTLRPRHAIHRDEFIRCSRCGKERRFRLKTADECRAFHDASANTSWTCSDSSCEKITCDDPEERLSRKVRRGCPMSVKCSGCMSCVCVGCGICKFKGCHCRTCVDFILNIGSRLFNHLI